MQKQLSKLPSALAKLNLPVQPHISSLIIGTGDHVSAWGAEEIMHHHRVDVTLITGPAVNSDTGVQYVEQNFKLQQKG
jgi:CO dehydrogenase/acetyl-CoA synthase gamma subunit (corrinoid Fe-S protein)